MRLFGIKEQFYTKLCHKMRNKKTCYRYHKEEVIKSTIRRERTMETELTYNYLIKRLLSVDLQSYLGGEPSVWKFWIGDRHYSGFGCVCGVVLGIFAAIIVWLAISLLIIKLEDVPWYARFYILNNYNKVPKKWNTYGRLTDPGYFKLTKKAINISAYSFYVIAIIAALNDKVSVVVSKLYSMPILSSVIESIKNPYIVMISTYYSGGTGIRQLINGATLKHHGNHHIIKADRVIQSIEYLYELKAHGASDDFVKIDHYDIGFTSSFLLYLFGAFWAFFLVPIVFATIANYKVLLVCAIVDLVYAIKVLEPKLKTLDFTYDYGSIHEIFHKKDNIKNDNGKHDEECYEPMGGDFKTKDNRFFAYYKAKQERERYEREYHDSCYGNSYYGSTDTESHYNNANDDFYNYNNYGNYNDTNDDFYNYDDYNNASATEEPKQESSYFSNCDTRDKVKERYRALIKIFHPDNNNGDEETFKKIDEEYRELLDKYKN